jgi:hypothetical protein
VPTVKANAVQLATLAALHGCPGGVTEYRFHPIRRWRFDLAWIEPDRRIALEVNGGLWTRGRHSRGTGQEADYEKHATATLLGWRVFWASTRQVNNGVAWGWIREALTQGG